jgi:hypothetical protein
MTKATTCRLYSSQFSGDLDRGDTFVLCQVHNESGLEGGAFLMRLPFLLNT